MENTNVSGQVGATPTSNQQTLPNSTGVLVLGILSIVFCVVPGLVMGIIALVLAGKAKKLYKDNPHIYTESSFKNMNAGWVCAIIGTCLSGLVFIFFIIYFLIIGATIGGFLGTFPCENYCY